MTETAEGVMVGVNTHLPNRLVTEGIESGLIAALSGYASLRSDVRYGVEKSRIDLLLQGAGERPDCYVEIKNVTTCDNGGAGFFPDAMSVRASRHLRELTEMVRQGQRAVIFFCVQRGDVQQVRPANEIDPHYGEALRAALAAGVEAIARRDDRRFHADRRALGHDRLPRDQHRDEHVLDRLRRNARLLRALDGGDLAQARRDQAGLRKITNRLQRYGLL